jgi:hypothetical protein
MSDSGIPQQYARPRFTPQLVMGLFIIAVGVLYTLENLGIADVHLYKRYWPLGLIAIGLTKLWRSREGSGGGAFGGFVVTLAGVWLLLEEVADVRIQFADMWPLLLVCFGVYLVWQGVAGRRRLGGADGNATVSAMAVLGGVARGNNSPAFRGGDLTAILGGCEVDLRQAAINGDAVIDVFALCGGIEIRVPDEWAVSSRVTPLLGGVEDKTRPPQGMSTHRLTLRGVAIMGGVEIKN